MLARLVKGALNQRLLVVVIAMVVCAFGIRASMKLSVDAFPDAEAIFGANLQTLRQLGAAGWAQLDVGPHVAGPAVPARAAGAGE